MAAKKPATAAADAAPEAFVRIKVLTPVRHDGQDMPEHQVQELNASAAQELVAAGLAELVRDDPAELSLA